MVVPIHRICRDPDDDCVIACAIADRADAVVSGADGLLTLEQAGGIPILTVAEFLETLERSN